MTQTKTKENTKMTRKRFIKLTRAMMTRCHEIHKARDTNLFYKPGRAINTRNVKLAEGKTYQEVWDTMSNALAGVINVGK